MKNDSNVNFFNACMHNDNDETTAHCEEEQSVNSFVDNLFANYLKAATVGTVPIAM
jgi:hypothetical protein